MNYIKTFVTGFIWGAAEGTAEGLTNAHVSVQPKDTDHNKAKPKSKNKSKPKSKSKSSKTRKSRTKSNKRFEEFKQKRGRSGLRAGDPSRTHLEQVKLYNSLPSDIRYGDDAKFWNFVDNREFGHQIAYSNGGDHSVQNMVWQDSRSNKRLGSETMDKFLRNKLKEQNQYFGKNGKESQALAEHLDLYFDEKRKSKPKKKSKRRKKGKKSKSKQNNDTQDESHSNHTTAQDSSNKFEKGAEIALHTTGHIVVSKIGNATGKKVGKVIGKKVAMKTGKKVAEKIGAKALKAIPIAGAVVGAVFAAKTIYDKPYSPWSYVSAASDIGTGFFGLAGMAVDVVVQSGCAVMDE